MRYLALLLLPALLSAAAPVVSNVRAQQRLGTKLIDITYDLADSDGGTVYISAQLFAGSTALPAFSLSGHIGAGVTPGAGKTIVWNAGQDWNRQYTSQGKVRIIADDLTVTPPNSSMVYVPAGFTAGIYGIHTTSSGYKVFSNGFFMDKTEISKATWDEVRTWALANGYTFDNTGLATDTSHPVVGVSWYDAVKWCNARSQKEGLAPVYFTDATRTTVYKTGTVIVRGTFCNWSADGYRLPTRAEWSKAAWGGSTSGPYYWPSYYGSGAEILNVGQANFFYSFASRSHPWDFSATTFQGVPNYGVANYGTTPVGYYNGSQVITGLALGVSATDMKNGFGLYDMAGNAAEWLWDSYYTEVTATTEYLDDNYKGPDLGLGAERYYAAGRLDLSNQQSNWDLQVKTAPGSAGTEKTIFYEGGSTSVGRVSGGGAPLYNYEVRIPQVGLRTVRGR
jgi:formylglycine-generating enzyme required for sulfatase activity